MSVYNQALVTVFNKKNLLECVKKLSQSGTKIISTGGTAKLLSESGVDVTLVHEQTKFREVMDGRVKTLHPYIFMPILARKNHPQDEKELQDESLTHFDLVICNLYPFEEKLNEEETDSMQWVDVGGPSLLRASAKNYEKVTVICDPEDYALVMENKKLTVNQRRMLAAKVFNHLSSYDQYISQYLTHSALLKNNGKKEKFFSKNFLTNKNDKNHIISGRFFKELRYGENPHQKASWYCFPFSKGLHDAQVIQGKPLSFNNILDIQSAVSTLREFSLPCFVGIKHNNPCAVACGESLMESVQKGLKADSLSIFGGVIALNRELDLQVAQFFQSLFFECLIVPSISQEAIQFFSKKKNLRILKWKNMMNKEVHQSMEASQIEGGFLLQDLDTVHLDWKNCKVDGEVPTNAIKNDLEMAWKVCAHLKSNAVCLVHDLQTVGMGMGQVDRVNAVELAIKRMKTHHENIVREKVVLASDGFFPFSDSVEKAAQEGIRWIIHPGGSLKDEEVIKRAQSLGVNVVRTKCRHFKH